VLDALMHSVAENHPLVRTPELAVCYEPADWPFARGVPPGELSAQASDEPRERRVVSRAVDWRK
jgi:hypothetical protein